MANGTQIAVRLEAAVVAALDEMVAAEEFASRAEAVRHALDVVLDARRRAATGAAIVAGYRRHPQTDADEQAALRNLEALVADEPW